MGLLASQKYLSPPNNQSQIIKATIGAGWEGNSYYFVLIVKNSQG